MIIEIADLKAHLNLDHDDDDTLLAGKIEAAQAHVSAYVGEDLDQDSPAALKEAVRQLAAHLYENREASIVDGTVRPIPLGFHDLIAPFRAWDF